MKISHKKKNLDAHAREQQCPLADSCFITEAIDP